MKGGVNFCVSSTNYKYNGKELQETGMYDYGARFYMPDIGRWGVIDNYSEKGYDRTPFGYVSNNPIMKIDPDGNWEDDIYINTETKQLTVVKTNDNYDRIIINGEYKGNTEKGYAKEVWDNNNLPSNEVNIKYGQGADKSAVSDYTTSVLVDTMNKAGESSIQINSTARSVEDQVRVMSEMVESRGMAAQKKMYGSAGDKVLDKYPDRKAMVETAKEIGPSKVSKHCVDPKQMNVVDVSPVNGGIKNGKNFSSTAQSNPSVSRVLSPWTPTYDPAIHIEIPQKKPR
nr:RHS repeat-associated core domain-containing protein [Chryseobacterium koreense]